MTVSAAQADAFDREVRVSRPSLVLAIVLVVVLAAGCGRADVPTPPVSPSPQGVEMSVTLYHCGFDPITYRGETWEASPEPFDATNKPSSWRGHGTVTEVGPDRLLFRDDSGVEVTFLPDAEVTPPPVCA